MTDLALEIQHGANTGKLLGSAARNILQTLEQSSSPLYPAVIDELLQAAAWSELNDRFYKTLAFGTGGLRGRTIGKIVTAAERGTVQPLDRPEFPCVGTNAMNYYNISRATQGLVMYLRKWWTRAARAGRPKIVIAHDPRHFSREFAELTARVAVENGSDAALFAGPRSTPQLSFAVRHLHASAGIVITASHNPPHDNGYKVYFDDGAQVVEPHASGIIAEVNAVPSDVYTPLPEPERGRLELLGDQFDEAYLERLETLLLDRTVVGAATRAGLKIVFTPIHGTGGIIVKPLFERVGFHYLTVPGQEQFDGRFPSVRSPNPENAEALFGGIQLAEKEGAEVVIATDPDCDRMGVAVRNRAGKIELLTGNQIGSLIAVYRVKKLIERGVITPENAGRCVIIKTLVTTDLQKAIAEKHGLRCVETLTGFKYIGAKLGKYEAALGITPAEYRALPETETRRRRLASASYYICGGEESYGYSAADFVRDKDGNGSALAFAEVAAYAKSRKLTVPELLDETYAEYGFYAEQNGNMTFEGAEGAAKIERLVESYAIHPPTTADDAGVVRTRNFATEEVIDVEGDRLPKEKMLIIELIDGRRVAVRPSGTEPKIKFYLFARRLPPDGQRFTSEQLEAIKREVASSLDALWHWIQRDVETRLS